MEHGFKCTYLYTSNGHKKQDDFKIAKKYKKSNKLQKDGKRALYRIDRKRRIYYYVYFKSKLNYNLLQQEKRKQNGGENADDRFKRKKKPFVKS